MKSVSLGTQNKIYLDDPAITTTEFNITYKVINEVGTIAKDTNDADIAGNAIFDETKLKYYAQFTLNTTSKGKYYRLTFAINDKDGNFVQSDFFLEDLIIEKQSTSVQLVPVSYFKDYIIGGGLDDDAKKRIADYPVDAIQELLNSATAELESEVKMVFTKRTIENEKHNWYGESLRETWWLIQTLQSPIVSLESYELWFAQKKIFSVLDMNNLYVHKIEGRIQFVPAAGQTFALMHYNSLEATLMSLTSFMPGTNYVPDVFRVSYTYGLDFMNLEEVEQTEIRMAIARRAMLNSIFLINKDLMKGSESQSADGVSYSFSNNAKQWYDAEYQYQQKWIWNIMRKYNKLVDIEMG